MAQVEKHGYWVQIGTGLVRCSVCRTPRVRRYQADNVFIEIPEPQCSNCKAIMDIICDDRFKVHSDFREYINYYKNT